MLQTLFKIKRSKSRHLMLYRNIRDTIKNDYRVSRKKIKIITSLKNRYRGTLSAPSDAYVRSFLYLLYTLIKLYYTHTHTKNRYRLRGDTAVEISKDGHNK